MSRRTCCIAYLAILVTLPIAAQEPFEKYYERQNAEAGRLHAQKEYAKSIAILKELTQRPELQSADDQFQHVLYNLACEYSLAGDTDKATATLQDAFGKGFLSSAGLNGDSDFDTIRNDRRFLLLVKELQTRERPQQLLWNSTAWQTPFREDLPEPEKIAGLSRLWSEAKFNFVFFSRRDGLDWDAQYISYLPRVQATKSTFEYYRVLAEFCAQLHDGHTNVNYPEELGERLGWPALTTKLVEGRVFLDNVRDPVLIERGLVRGLEVQTVDGLPVREYGEKNVAPMVGASTQQDLEVRTFEARLLGGPLDQPVTLELRDALGKITKTVVPRISGSNADKLPHAPWKRFEYKVLPGNIAYVAMRSFSNNGVAKDFAADFAEIRKSEGLILDVRENGGGSSNVGWEILGFLTDKTFSSTQWRTRDYRPSYRAWGQTEKWFSQGASELPAHGPDPYRKPVVVLIGAHTYSAAEDFAVVFDAMKRGKIIGEPSGGSTGQPLDVALPGGGSVRICTKHDRYPDGKEFVGVGIQPNIVVRCSVDDFRAGRDTVLEAAIGELQRAK